MDDTNYLELIRKKFIHHKRRTLAASGKQAAVLLLLADCPDGCSVILTKRVRSLEHHGGEVSFPGGMREKTDLCLKETALRETNEEIGIPTGEIKVLGILDDELSRWGHRVTPFVGVTTFGNLFIQKSEVDKIYRVPVRHFMNPEIYWTEKWHRNSQIRTVDFFRYERDIVWGLTGRIIRKFIDGFITR